METVLGTRRKELPQLSDSACDKCLMYQLFNISKQELIKVIHTTPIPIIKITSKYAKVPVFTN